MSQITTSPIPPVLDLPKVSIWNLIQSQHSSSLTATDIGYIDEDSSETLSYQDVFDLSRAVASVFIHRLHLKKGDLVIIFSENSIKYPIILLATQVAGLVCSPANAAYQPKELAYQIMDSKAHIVVTSVSKYSVARAACKEAGISEPILISDTTAISNTGIKTLWDMIDHSRLDVVPITQQEAVGSTALLCYSSGTSGQPKGVKTSNYNISSAILQSRALSPSSYSSHESWIAIHVNSWDGAL
ncbi:hypothetical protein ONZ45_g9060 [Pleurotus djamor]|nr:hypothetical protein ONZ45_g9060 [Pleurotus djamor]